MAGHYDIILCTCNETASRRMLQLAKEDRIAQCIVDESGMSHEPETITAISLCNHVVLIGDHKQLQPVIKYSPAKESGLSTSLFERYAEHFPNLLITLNTQYRMVRINCVAWSLHSVNCPCFVIYSMKQSASSLHFISTMVAWRQTNLS